MAARESIDGFVQQYLEGKGIPSFEYVLQSLLTPAGYETGVGVSMFGSNTFSRRNQNGSVDLVTAYNLIEYHQTNFGNSNWHLSRNLTYLTFSDGEDHSRFEGLCKQMHSLSEQEGVSHRGTSMIDYQRDMYINIQTGAGTALGLLFGGIIGAILPHYINSVTTYHNTIEFINSPLTKGLIVLSGFVLGGTVGTVIARRRCKKNLKKLDAHRAELKEQYGKLFQQFSETYGPRMSFGKKGLEKALLSG